MDALVNFLVAGTQKGGTTALWELLRGHPDVCLAREKEVHYFDFDHNFAPPGPDYARYHGHFDDPDGRSAVGEATPISMYWRAAPARIAAYNPAMRLVFLLRNPVERAWSHYRMERHREAETWPFARALRLEDWRRRAAGPGQHRIYSYVDRGFYSRQIGRMLACFPRRQMLFLRSEDLLTRRQATFDRLCDFLELDRLDVGRVAIEPPRPHDPMPDADRRWLERVFAPELDALEPLLDWDCSAWRPARTRS